MEVKNDPNASYKLLASALADIGYSSKEMMLGDFDVVTYTKGNKSWITRKSRISYPSTHRFARDVSAHKNLAYELAKRVGVAVPFTISLKAKEKLDEKLANSWLIQHRALIVKPQQASLSHGLTLDITSTLQLKNAIEKAKGVDSESDSVLIQQQIYGNEIRFVYLGGEIIAAMLRRSPSIIGDGEMTTRQLIDGENQERRKISNTMVEYPQLSEALITEQINLDYVPERGEVVELSKSTMISGGASIYNIIDKVHGEHIKAAQTMARSLGVGFVVVDMLIDDYSTAGGGYFNEFNVSPVLKLFYSCRDGRHVNILPELAEVIDKTLV